MSLKATLADRFGLDRIWNNVLRRRVPVTPWFLGDGAALTTLLAIQVITGITMTLYYTDSAEYAYESVRYITERVTLGWLVRGIHYWSAGIMVVMTAVHVSRHLLLGGYKAPREGTWTIGVFLLFLVLAMSYTGYVLRWDEEAYYAAGILLNILHLVPFVGNELVVLFQGGSTPGTLTLSRFYSLHIWIVPLLLFGFLGYHLYLVILHGVTHREEWRQDIRSAEEHKIIYHETAHTEERGEWFYPDAMFTSGITAFTTFCVAFVLAAVLGPPRLFPEANLVAASMPEEEWWFSWFSALVALLPPNLAHAFQLAIPLLLFMALFFLPVLDRGPNRGIRRRPFWTALVIAGFIGIVWLSDLRRRSPWTGRPDPEPPPAPAGVVLEETPGEGRLHFARYGCNSCHAVSGYGPAVGPDLARLKDRFSPSELRRYILAPPEGIPMPGYEGRMPDSVLACIVEYVLVAQTFPRSH